MTDTTDPQAEPVEPDNPAAYALARHIADHPVSTVQAAFRYLNSPLTIELHEDAAVPSAPAGRAALRQEIRRVLAAVDGFNVAWLDPQDYGPQADAVLSVLPATTDRATVLREAADVVVRAARGCGDSETGQYAASVAAGIGKELRRMADEAQQPETQARLAAHQTCRVCGAGYLTGGSCGTCEFNARMAVEARQADTAGEQQ